MTATELLSNFRSLSRDEKIEFLDGALHDLRTVEGVRIVDGIVFHKPGIDDRLSQETLAESRQRLSQLHLAEPAEDFLTELSEKDFQN